MSPVFHRVEDEEDANHHEMVLIESGQKSCKFETLIITYCHCACLYKKIKIESGDFKLS